MPAYRYLHYDVFTDSPLTGNQLAVFTDPAGLDTDTMARMTREMNFSECTFVRQVAPGSLIHAIDLDGSALRKIPSAHKGVRISTYHGDFMKQPWPFAGLDGVLMANSLHYVENQAAFIRECESHMNLRRHFLLVEYNTSEASRWIPYPVSQIRLTTCSNAPVTRRLECCAGDHRSTGALRCMRSPSDCSEPRRKRLCKARRSYERTREDLS